MDSKIDYVLKQIDTWTNDYTKYFTQLDNFKYIHIRTIPTGNKLKVANYWTLCLIKLNDSDKLHTFFCEHNDGVYDKIYKRNNCYEIDGNIKCIIDQPIEYFNFDWTNGKLIYKVGNEFINHIKTRQIDILYRFRNEEIEKILVLLNKLKKTTNQERIKLLDVLINNFNEIYGILDISQMTNEITDIKNSTEQKTLMTTLKQNITWKKYTDSVNNFRRSLMILKKNE